MTTMKVVVVISVLVVYYCCEVSSTSFINKCCPKGMYSEKMKCKSLSTNITSHEEDWEWIPAKYREELKHLNITEEHVSYGHNMPCAGSMSTLLNFNRSDFQLNITGSKIFLEILEENEETEKNEVAYIFPSSAFCIDMSKSINMILATLCPCLDKPCVRKCCHYGDAFNITDAKCVTVSEDTHPYDWMHTTLMGEKPAKPYELIGIPGCKDGEHHVSRVMKKDTPKLNLRADLSMEILDTKEIFPAHSWCGDYNMNYEEMLLVCRPQPESYSILYGICFLVGALALLLTVLVSLLLPDLLRCLHGRLALAHNSMLCIGYVITGIMHILGTGILKVPYTCRTLSFMTQFSILAAFFWLNVMCIDISWVFSGLRPPRGNAMQRETKKFIYYSLYAWGSTIIITIATMILELSPRYIDSPFRPNFGENGCFFNSKWAMGVFFYGPMSILLILNLALFIYTATKILLLKRQTAILHSTDSTTSNKNKQRLVLYAKLFSIMGITWLLEVISWAVGGPAKYWVFTDVLNLLRGVFIFIIFCCKKKTFRQVRDRLLRMCGKEAFESNASGRDGRSFNTSSSSITSKAPGGSMEMTPGGTPGSPTLGCAPEVNRRVMLQKQNTQTFELNHL